MLNTYLSQGGGSFSVCSDAEEQRAFVTKKARMIVMFRNIVPAIFRSTHFRGSG